MSPGDGRMSKHKKKFREFGKFGQISEEMTEERRKRKGGRVLNLLIRWRDRDGEKMER
jgi:hypothetical protein